MLDVAATKPRRSRVKPGLRGLLLLSSLGAAVAPLAGCSPAPLAGKACPCASGFSCCETTMTCLPDGGVCPAPTCSSSKLTNLVITSGGAPLPGDSADAGDCHANPAVRFGVSPEQWITYTYSGNGQPPPCLEATPDGNGIHVTATFDAGSAANSYEGVGLSFLADNCIDGGDLTGLQFEFAGDLGGHLLYAGVTSSEDVNVTFPRGSCMGSSTMCYGPTASVDDLVTGVNRVPFSRLIDGVPETQLNAQRIVNVQWQLQAAEHPNADFTIKNATFY